MESFKCASTRFVSFLIVGNIVFACLYSPFISEITVLHVVSAALTVLVSFFCIINFIYRGTITDQETFFAWIILFLIGKSAFYFMSGVMPGELTRAYLSFIYLPVFALLCMRLPEKELMRILKVIMLVGIMTSLFVIPFFVEFFYLKSIGYSRFTAYLDLVHTPILIITIPLTYIFLDRSKYFVLLIILIAIFATQSKGQIIFGLFALSWCELKGYKFQIKNMFKAAVLIVMIFSPFLFFQDTIAKRFLDMSGSTSMHRVEELVVGYKHFTDSPILGGGPKTIFAINESKLAVDDGEQRYIHNVVVYFLATGGVVGLLMYLYPFIAVFKGHKSNADIKYLAISIYAAFLYLLLSATFKSIQTNLFIGLMIGVLVSLSQIRARKC